MPCVRCLEGRECELHKNVTWEDAQAKLMAMRQWRAEQTKLLTQVEKVLDILEDREFLRQIGIEPV